MRLLLILFLVAGLLSCAKPVAEVTYTYPPRYYGGDVRKVAVLPFKVHDGGSLNGELLASEIESYLSGVRLDGEPYFTVVDRQKIKEVMDELMFSSSGLTQDVARLGRLLRAEGLVIGSAEVNYTFNSYWEERSRCKKTKGSGLIKECVELERYRIPCTERSVQFILIPKLIEVDTGKILYSRRIKSVRKERYCYDYGNPPTSIESLVESAKEGAIREFLRDIAPYKVKVKAEFIDNDEEVGNRELFKKAIALARDGKVEEACDVFGSLEGDGYALLYNKGLCAERVGNLEEAKRLYYEALRMKKDERIKEALERIEKAVQNERELRRLRETGIRQTTLPRNPQP